MPIRSLRQTPPSSTPIPARWKRGRQMAALASLIWVGLGALALSERSGADALDASWLRARFTMREWFRNHFGEATRDDRIVLVEIDDKSANKWNNEPLIMWGGRLAGALETLNRSGARMIALDWMQNVETDARLGWNHDERLGHALATAKNVALVKFIRSDGGYIVPAPSLLYALPGAVDDGGASFLGYAELPGGDSVQTTILPATEANELSFAARIVERLGLDWRRAPRRRDGSVFVNFADNAGARGPNSPFVRVSLADLVGRQGADSRFKDKIVILGATYKGNNDFHRVPFFDTLSRGGDSTAIRQIAGMELQAHAVATLLDAKSLREPSPFGGWILASLLGVVGVGFFALAPWRRAVLSVLALCVCWLALSFVAFSLWNFALPLSVPILILLLGAGLMGGFRAFSEERERGQVLKVWGRYQDPLLIQELLENPDLRSGQGREVEVTVLFADLKHFTKTVEHLTPSQALVALNRYLGLMATTIREHGGLVDKYLGDGLMAQWGAPLARPDHARAAVMACLDIEKRLAVLSQDLQKSGDVCFEARLTLHSGLVMAGPLGAEEKLEYTLIGDTVNVTSRLQETAKELGADFLISETTRSFLGEEVALGRETSVAIRGRDKPLAVFEVLGAHTEQL